MQREKGRVRYDKRGKKRTYCIDATKNKIANVLRIRCSSKLHVSWRLQRVSRFVATRIQKKKVERKKGVYKGVLFYLK